MVSNKYCIIMAGGVGSRFWPVSRYAHPKQFLDILGTGRSFLQTTVDRFKRIVPVENILIVSAKQYEGLIAQQVPEIPKDNVLLENRKRNTAPCIAYATYKLYKKDPSATVVVTPADHLILNEDVFLETVETVLNHACTSDALFTLGIKPTRPETQYGYIQANKAKAEIVSGHASYQVKTFTEKPDLEMAKVLFSSGEFLWNSGIFIWNLKTIKKEMETHIPDIAASFADIAEYYYTAPGEEEQLIHSWTWSLNSAGTATVGRKLAAMDFFPPQNAANSMYYHYFCVVNEIIRIYEEVYPKHNACAGWHSAKCVV